MTKIKFCGLFRKEDILSVNRLKPDYAGFVFYEKSHRNVTRAQAEEFRSLLKPEIKAVGVFVDRDIETIVSLVKDNVINLIQLHGNEDDDYIRTLREKTGAEIIKAFQIKNDPLSVDHAEVLERAEKCPADHILIDSGKGTGKTFDWSVLKSIKRPFFLAGGIDSSNAVSAIENLHPFCLDLSSGIETDKVKDEKKMAEILALIKAKEAALD